MHYDLQSQRSTHFHISPLLCINLFVAWLEFLAKTSMFLVWWTAFCIYLPLAQLIGDSYYCSDFIDLRFMYARVRLVQVRAFGALLKYLDAVRLGVEFEDYNVKTPIIRIKTFTMYLCSLLYNWLYLYDIMGGAGACVYLQGSCKMRWIKRPKRIKRCWF